MSCWLLCTSRVKGQLRTTTWFDEKTERNKKRERTRDRGNKQSQMWVTWHRRSVHSGQGQRSAVSNPPCPLPWTWRSMAPSLPTTPQDITTVSQWERRVYSCRWQLCWWITSVQRAAVTFLKTEKSILLVDCNSNKLSLFNGRRVCFSFL